MWTRIYLGDTVPAKRCGLLLALLCLLSLWHSAAGDDTAEVLAVGVNMNSNTPWLRRVIEIPKTASTLTVCLHLRILFLRTNPSLIFFMQDSLCFLRVRDKRLEARVGSQMLIHKHPLPTHEWLHLCLVVAESPELAIRGKYTTDVDVKSSGHPELRLQGNATLWLGRSQNASIGLHESVGGYATLPQMYPSRLSEDQVASLASCDDMPDGDLGTVAWEVMARVGELLGYVDSGNLTRLVHQPSRSLSFEVAQGVCWPHAPDHLLLLPGHYTSYQAARRCTSLGGRLPNPGENRLPAAPSLITRWQDNAFVTCWVGTHGDYFLLSTTKGKNLYQPPEDGMYTNVSTGFCCQVPYKPIMEMRTQMSNDQSGRFAIAPSATQLRFVSPIGDMINVREDQLDVEIRESWAWSMTFDGHWMGRHEVINSSKERQEPGRQVVLTVCGQDEFTCTDGYCVSLDARCDGHDDCGDEADERHCEILLETPGAHGQRWPRRLIPSVNLTLSLVKIEEIDEDKLTVKSWLQLRSTWHDDHLTLWHLSQHSEDNVIPVGKVSRVPSYSLDNGVFESLLHRHNPEHKVVTLRAKKLRDGVPGLFELHEGYKFSAMEEAVMIMTEDFLASFSCLFDYQNYPMDVQTCDFNISLITDSHSRPYFDIQGVKTVSSVFYMNLFTVMPLRQLCLTELPPKPSSISFRILLQRRYFTHIWTTLLPSIIISLIGLLTFFFDADNFTDRIMVTLSCFIVLATLFTQDVISGPRHSSFRNIDLQSFYTLFRLFVVFLCHVFQLYLQKWLKRVQAQQEEKGIGQIPSNSIKVAPVMESKTSEEDNIHLRVKTGHETKDPWGGWMHEAATNTHLNAEAISLQQSSNRDSKRSPFCSSFGIFFLNNRKWFRVFGITIWLAVDSLIMYLLIKSSLTTSQMVYAKYREYCDTNVD